MELITNALQISILIIFVKMLAFGFVSQNERKCKYSRVNKLTTVRCYYMDLRDVPQSLKSSLEVLDLSFNRIKKLKKSSFQKYTDLQFLLLYENMIQSVEEGTFSSLTSLQEIDLSSNALMTIPVELFQLPKLRNLYIDSNDLRFLKEDLKALKRPIKAPLEYLNIANCDLYDLPDFGILPNLWHLNASLNPLKELTIDNFAYMCHLKTIDITKTEMSICKCQQVNEHLSALGADRKYAPVCLGLLSESECPMPYNQTVASDTFKSCRRSTTVSEARSFWLFAVGCFGGVVLVLLVVWYCMHRRRKQRLKRKSLRAVQNRKNFVISPKNAMNNNQHENELLRCDIA